MRVAAFCMVLLCGCPRQGETPSGDAGSAVEFYPLKAPSEVRRRLREAEQKHEQQLERHMVPSTE